MNYPWPEVRYRFTGGKPPTPKQKQASKPEPTAEEYRRFIFSVMKYLEGTTAETRGMELLLRGVPRNGEQG